MLKKEELLGLMFELEKEYEDLFIGMIIQDNKFDKSGLGKLCEDGNGIKIYIGDLEGKDDYIIYYSYKPEYTNNPAYKNAICINELEKERIYIKELISLLNRQSILTINEYLES